MDHLLGQRGGGPAPGSSISTFRSDLPRAAFFRSQTSLGNLCDLCSGATAIELACSCGLAAQSQRGAALGPGPVGDGLPGAFLRGRRGSAALRLPPGEHAYSSATIEVDHPRHNSRDHAVHAILCNPIPDRFAAHRSDESIGVVAGDPATDFRVRHLPLPVDGRGSDFQAWHGLHVGGGGDCRSLFCSGGGRGRTGASAGAELRTHWIGACHCGHGAAV